MMFIDLEKTYGIPSLKASGWARLKQNSWNINSMTQFTCHTQMWFRQAYVHQSCVRSSAIFGHYNIGTIIGSSLSNAQTIFMLLWLTSSVATFIFSHLCCLSIPGNLRVISIFLKCEHTTLLFLPLTLSPVSGSYS